MKVLIIGGIKSGKSSFAEDLAKKMAKKKPYYLATTEFIDKEMKKKIKKHKKQRKDSFITIEEAIKLHKKIKKLDDVVLIEDISMWINNMLYHKKEKKIFLSIKKLLHLEQDIVFVINNVSESIIPATKLSRDFTTYNGLVAQIIAKECDSVYELVAGIGKKIK